MIMVEKALAVIALVFMSGSVLAQSSTALPSADQAAIKAACTDLVLDYAYYRDRPDAAGFANVFTKDGELRVMGQAFIGRKATGVSYVTVYSAPAGTVPAKVSDFAAVGEYHDELVLTEAGWKIARREFVPVFLPPDS